MKLKISHTTRYSYDEPVPFVMQQIRLVPKDRSVQKVVDWQVEIEGGHEELRFEDHNRNTVQLLAFEPDRHEITISCRGEVETADTNGIVGEHRGFTPLWYFKRDTELTKPGMGVRKLVKSIGKPNGDQVATLHTLAAEIGKAVRYEIGQTHVSTTAESALEAGHGVCQDHVHVFLSAARLLGIPARYVSGYLMIDGRIDQDATHAWAEAHVGGLGWVGFDVANGISPDERYVGAATGLDYTEAAPVSGMRLGQGNESLYINVQVQQ